MQVRNPIRRTGPAHRLPSPDPLTRLQMRLRQVRVEVLPAILPLDRDLIPVEPGPATRIAALHLHHPAVRDTLKDRPLRHPEIDRVIRLPVPQGVGPGVRHPDQLPPPATDRVTIPVKAPRRLCAALRR